MYIFIREDGDVYAARAIIDDEYEMVNNGILTIIDISDPEHPIEYWNDKWVPVQIN